MPVLEAVASALGTPLPARHRAGRRPARSASSSREGGGGATQGREGGASAARALRLVLSDGGQIRSGPGGCPRPTALPAGADPSWALTPAGRHPELAHPLSRLPPEVT